MIIITIWVIGWAIVVILAMIFAREENVEGFGGAYIMFTVGLGISMAMGSSIPLVIVVILGILFYIAEYNRQAKEDEIAFHSLPREEKLAYIKKTNEDKLIREFTKQTI